MGPHRATVATLTVLLGVLVLTGCQPSSTSTGATPGHAATGPAAAAVAAASCAASGTVIPVGHYSGPVKATLTTTMHLDVGGVTIPHAGGGTEVLKGTVSLASDGQSVTGSITLSGLGLSQVGVPGGVAVHSVDNGGLTGRISGPSSAPIVTGTVGGEWASLDAPVLNGRGSAEKGFRAGLHVTSSSCTSVSGDAIAMFAQVAAPVRQYLTIGGSGSWTATSS